VRRSPLAFRNETGYPDDEVERLVRFALDDLELRRTVKVRVSYTRLSTARKLYGGPYVYGATGVAGSSGMALRIGRPDDFPVPWRDRRPKQTGTVGILADWREALVAIAAHEGKHVEGYHRRGWEGGQAEEDRCDAYARRVLRQYRERPQPERRPEMANEETNEPEAATPDESMPLGPQLSDALVKGVEERVGEVERVEGPKGNGWYRLRHDGATLAYVNVSAKGIAVHDGLVGRPSIRVRDDEAVAATVEKIAGLTEAHKAAKVEKATAAVDPESEPEPVETLASSSPPPPIPVPEKETSLRPRPGETAEETVDRVVKTVQVKPDPKPTAEKKQARGGRRTRGRA
jgi:hypothetical protein